MPDRIACEQRVSSKNRQQQCGVRQQWPLIGHLRADEAGQEEVEELAPVECLCARALRFEKSGARRRQTRNRERTLAGKSLQHGLRVAEK